MSWATCVWPTALVVLLIFSCSSETASDDFHDADQNEGNDTESWCDGHDSSICLLQVSHDLPSRHPRISGEYAKSGNDINSDSLSVETFHDQEEMSRGPIAAISLDAVAHKQKIRDALKLNTQLPSWVPIFGVGLLLVMIVALALFYSSGEDSSTRRWLKEVTLYDLPPDCRNSYYLFGLALGISLATLQFIGPVRTAVFLDVVGTAQEPLAKSLVLVVLLPIIMVYSLAVSLLPSARFLVVVVNGFYTLVFLFITVMLASYEGQPPKWIAWVLYFAAETKGVILMPMIWSVIADKSTSELSKKAYPFVFFVTQLGGICGSLIAIKVSSLGGEVGLLLIQTVTLMVIAGLTWAGCSVIQEEEVPAIANVTIPTPEDSRSKSLWSIAMKRVWEGSEGIWLLISRPYVFMCFFVSYATLVTRTIMDYENAVLVKKAWPETDDQVAYFGHMTLFQNIAIAFITLLGTRQLVESFSVGSVLLILPVVSMVCITALCVNYELLTSTMACIIASTVAYSLNSPCKEILFVRTSRDIKYKAKSWSEMYGNNIMKILGAQVNLWVNNEANWCKPNCFNSVPTLILSAIWVVIWIFVVLNVGAQFQQLDAEDKIIS